MLPIHYRAAGRHAAPPAPRSGPSLLLTWAETRGGQCPKEFGLSCVLKARFPSPALQARSSPCDLLLSNNSPRQARLPPFQHDFASLVTPCEPGWAAISVFWAKIEGKKKKKQTPWFFLAPFWRKSPVQNIAPLHAVPVHAPRPVPSSRTAAARAGCPLSSLKIISRKVHYSRAKCSGGVLGSCQQLSCSWQRARTPLGCPDP